MKKGILTIAAVCLFAVMSFAQRFAYVDTEYILQSVPAYQKAQNKLDAQAAKWQQLVDKTFKDADAMYKKYQAEQFLLTEEMKVTRQEEIFKKERAAQDMQRKYFGFEGDLFKKRQELIQPIQDKIYDVIQKLAEERAFDFILDKASGGATLLYTNTKHDLSETVLRRINF